MSSDVRKFVVAVDRTGAKFVVEEKATASIYVEPCGYDRSLTICLLVLSPTLSALPFHAVSSISNSPSSGVAQFRNELNPPPSAN